MGYLLWVGVSLLIPFVIIIASSVVINTTANIEEQQQQPQLYGWESRLC